MNSSNESESKSQLISSPPTPVSSSNSEKKHSETSDATDTSEHEGDETIDPVDFTAWANQNHTENLIDFAQILINNFDSETGELKQLNATDQQTFDHANEMSLKMYGDGVVEHGQIEQIGKTEHKVFDRRACCFAQFPVLAMGDCLVDSLLVGMIGVRFYEAGEEEVKDRSAKFRIELAEFVQLNRAALQKAIYDYEPDESESMDKIIAELKKPYVHLRK